MYERRTLCNAVVVAIVVIVVVAVVVIVEEVVVVVRVVHLHCYVIRFAMFPSALNHGRATILTACYGRDTAVAPTWHARRGI